MTNPATYQKRHDEGVCPSCNGKTDDKHVHCQSCLRRLRKYRREHKTDVATSKRRYYHKAKNNGLCAHCGNKRDDVGFVLCIDCRIQMRLARRKTGHEIRQTKCPKCGGKMMNDNGDIFCFQCGYRPTRKVIHI